ncbi:MAG: hypothetical protein KDD69_19645, partial [Bdellovibrionales bacterium]|nr:hypothetical protein [Bdellovibrionales bacterium]
MNKRLLNSMALLGATLVASPAFAADFVLTFGVSQDLTLNTGDKILVDAGANRSYTCEAVPLEQMTDFDFSATIVGTDMTDPETVTARL